MADLSETIETAATKPQKASSPAGSVEMPPLPDVIAADKYLKGQTAQTKASRGMRLSQIIPPGSV